MALIKSKQIESINLAQLVALSSVNPKANPVDVDSVVINDVAGGNVVKITTMADLVDNYIEAEIDELKQGIVTLGDGSNPFHFRANGAHNIVIEPAATKGKITVQDGDNDNILLEPHGTGLVQVKNKIASQSGQNLSLSSLSANSGEIVVVEGANNNIKLAPNGSGKIELGSGSANAEVISSGNQDLILKTGNATTGSISIADGAGGNIAIHPDGSGSVDVGSKKITNLADPSADADGANKRYVDSVAQGLRWIKPVKVATTGELSTNHTGVVYDDAANYLESAANEAFPTVDGVPLVANNSEASADRILVKDQAGLKGFLQFSVNGVPTNGQNMTFEMGDKYYQINFVDGSTGASWGGGNGSTSNARMTIDVKRNNGGESETTIATSIAQVFNLEPNIVATGASEVVRLEQKHPKDQGVTNNVAGTAGTDNESAGAGKSSHNGIYYLHTAGSAGSKWRLYRATDADNAPDLSSAAVFVEEGTNNADQGYVQTLLIGDLDNDHQEWGQFTGLGQIAPELPLKKVGSQLFLNIEEANQLTAPAAGDLFVLADADASNEPKRLSLEAMVAFTATGAEFASNGGVLSLVNNTIASARLSHSANVGEILVGKGAGSSTVYEAPKTLSEAANSGLSMSTYSPTGGSDVADLKLDHVVKYAKYDGSAAGSVSNVGAADPGTDQANTWKVTNIASVGDKAALSASHPMARQVFFFRNGVLDETLMGLTNKFGQPIDGDNQFTFFNDGTQLNLLIKDGNANLTDDAQWGEDDIAVMFTHMA